MRARAKEQGSNRFLDIGRDGIIGVAVAGMYLSVRLWGRSPNTEYMTDLADAQTPNSALSPHLCPASLQRSGWAVSPPHCPVFDRTPLNPPHQPTLPSLA